MMQRLRAQDGVSLVELLVTIIIAGIIGAAVVTSVVTANRTERTMQSVRDNMDEARIALDRVRVELRGARRVFADPTDGLHLSYWHDRNHDEVIQGDEIVHYELVEAGDRWRLERWNAATPDARTVVARNLLYDPDDPPFDTPPFTYDQSPPLTRLVDIVLVVDAGGDRVDPKTVTAQVRLRNVQ